MYGKLVIFVVFMNEFVPIYMRKDREREREREREKEKEKERIAVIIIIYINVQQHFYICIIRIQK